MAKKKIRNYKTKHDGDGFVTLGGSVLQAFTISKLSVKLETITTSKRFLNEKVEQTAARGLKITGTLAYHHCTKDLQKAIEAWKNDGEYPELTVQGWCQLNGKDRSEVLVTDVVLSELPLLDIDDSADDEIVFECSFTANDYQVIE